jgi:hypothetical protein
MLGLGACLGHGHGDLAAMQQGWVETRPGLLIP